MDRDLALLVDILVNREVTRVTWDSGHNNHNNSDNQYFHIIHNIDNDSTNHYIINKYNIHIYRHYHDVNYNNQYRNHHDDQHNHHD